jgi:NADPH:quinone reductase-like Zn-dependent oxidoreductase
MIATVHQHHAGDRPGQLRVRPGDEVFGGCKGSFAEYASASESELTLKPANLTFEQAAALPVAGVTALKAMRDVAHVQHGQKVLINNAFR